MTIKTFTRRTINYRGCTIQRYDHTWIAYMEDSRSALWEAETVSECKEKINEYVRSQIEESGNSGLIH